VLSGAQSSLNHQVISSGIQKDVLPINFKDFLTLERKVGRDEQTTKSEFLLVRFGRSAFAHNGDILYSDEYKIKIFDITGKEKKILGGRGQGPGEFINNPSFLYISNSGYITATEGTYYTLYDSNYTFIEKKRIPRDILKNTKYKDYYGPFTVYVYSLQKNEKIYQLSSFQESDNKNESPFLLFYEKNNTITLLLDLKESNSSVFGRVSFNIIENSRQIAYINGMECINPDINENEYYYTLHLLSIDNRIEKTFKRKIKPLKFTEKEIESMLKPLQSGKPLINVDRTEEGKKMKRIKYKCPHFGIGIFYNNYLFIRSGDTAENVCDIFDLQSGQFKKRLIVEDSYPPQIRNGHTYKLEIDKDGFVYIAIYKVNPKLYDIIK
jgi:hypothetical protein